MWYVLEQCSLTGGKHNSFAISVFLIFSASSSDRPITRSVIYELDAMALPQPKVLNLTSEMMPFSSTRICSFMTSPQLPDRMVSHLFGMNTRRNYSRRGADETSANVRRILWERADLQQSPLSDNWVRERPGLGVTHVSRLFVV